MKQTLTILLLTIGLSLSAQQKVEPTIQNIEYRLNSYVKAKNTEKVIVILGTLITATGIAYEDMQITKLGCVILSTTFVIDWVAINRLRTR